MSANTRDANQTAPVCSLGMDRATVAAWHDGALGTAEAARIERHVATCPACQARLADFERVEGIVRSERVPMPDARLWAAVRAGHVGRLRPVKSKSPLIGGLGALAAVLLLALGFAQLFRVISAPPAATKTATAAATVTPSAMPSATPAATSVVPNALTWTPIALPPGFTSVSYVDGTDVLAPAPSDGRTAYACFFPNAASSGTPQLWVTHSTGSQWTQVALPATQGAVNDCWLLVDSLDPAVLLVRIGTTYPNGWNGNMYVSFNGGASWRVLPANVYVFELATLGGNTYVATQSTVDGTSHVQVSGDGLRTMHPIDGGIISQHDGPVEVWIKPDTGELRVLALHGTHGKDLFSSRDGGASWKLLTSTGDGQIIVGQLVAGKPWPVCRTVDGLGLFECDLDGNPQGRFTSRPLPPNGGVAYLGLASNGTVLAAGVVGSGTTPELFTLAPGASRWIDRGPQPEPGLTDTMDSGGDLLWAIPGIRSSIDPQGRVFVARLA